MKISYHNTKNVDIFSSLLMIKHAENIILPPLYWIPSTVLMLSPTCTDVIPHMYWCYPPMYWIPSTVLKLSPLYWCYPPLYWTTSTVLKVSTQYWSYRPHVLLLSPHSTEGIPPQYWHHFCPMPNNDNSQFYFYIWNHQCLNMKIQSSKLSFLFCI